MDSPLTRKSTFKSTRSRRKNRKRKLRQSTSPTARNKRRKLMGLNKDKTNGHESYDEDSDINNINHTTNNNKMDATKKNKNKNTNNNGTTEIYCICRGPDDGTHMVQCGDCTEWFHTRCLSYTQKEVDSLQYADQFLCPNDCQGSNHTKKKQLEAEKKQNNTKKKPKSKTKTKTKSKSKRNNTKKRDRDSMDEDSTSTASSITSSKENYNGTKRKGKRSRNKNRSRVCNEDINIVLAENDNNVDVMTAMHSIDRMIKGLEESSNPEEDLLSRYNISFDSEYDDIDSSGPFESEGDIIKVMIEKLKARNTMIDELRDDIKEYEEQREEIINLKKKIKEYEEQKEEVKDLKKKHNEDKEQLNRKWEAEIENMSNKNIKLLEIKDDKINELQQVIVDTERNKNEEIHSLNNELQSAKEEILILQEQLQENTENEKDDSQNSDKHESQNSNKSNDSDKTDITLTKTIPSLPNDLISPLSTTTAQRASTVIESQSSSNDDSQNVHSRNIQIDIDMTNDESEDEMDIDDEDMNEPEPGIIHSNHSASSLEWWQCESCGFENDPKEQLCQICTTQNTQLSQM